MKKDRWDKKNDSANEEQMKNNEGRMREKEKERGE